MQEGLCPTLSGLKNGIRKQVVLEEVMGRAFFHSAFLWQATIIYNGDTHTHDRQKDRDTERLGIFSYAIPLKRVPGKSLMDREGIRVAPKPVSSVDLNTAMGSFFLSESS